MCDWSHANVTNALAAETFIYIYLVLEKKRYSPVGDSRTDSATEFLAITGEQTIWGICTHPSDNGGKKGRGGLIFSSFSSLSSHLRDPAPLNLPSQVGENTGRKKSDKSS